MATLPKVLISRADYQIGGGVALGLRTQGCVADIETSAQLLRVIAQSRRVAREWVMLSQTVKCEAWS
ncbi:MAG TPA: hypothetical protein VGJ08_09440, partial [Rhizomicrobium sp.]